MASDPPGEDRTGAGAAEALPPVLADTAPAAPDFAAAPDPTAPAPPSPPSPLFHGRLHPLTLVFAALDSLKSVAVPLIAFGLFGRGDGAMHPLFWVLLGVPIYSAVVRYFTFSYRIENGELITKHGLLSRSERHIPLTRVQDIHIEQGVLHRAFGVVDAQVETGAGEGAEASLSVLSRVEAERLREAVFARVPRRAPSDTAATAATEAAADAEILRRLTPAELALEGLTSNRTASVLVVVAVGFGLVDDVVPRQKFEEWVREGTAVVAHWGERYGDAAWLFWALCAVALLVIGVVISIVGSILLFHDFTLARRGEDLQRRYGLLRRRSSNLPRRRIQILKVEEGLLQRWLRLATIRADTASGSSDEEGRKTGRDVLLPIVRRDEVPGLLPKLLPELEGEPTLWQSVSPRAIRRGFLKGTVGLLAITGLLLVLKHLLGSARWLDLWPLLLLPIVYWLNVVSYRHLGYATGPLYFQARRGWLGRAWHIVPLRNAQALVLHESPFDRHHGVATLQVDTAGQAQTGGAPEIANLPRDEALQLARCLAHLAAATRYRWR